MIKPFYSDAGRRLHLEAEANKWIGTPFHPHARIPGAGVDCVHLIASIYIQTGLLESFNPPAYTIDGGQHDEIGKVVEYVEQTGRFMVQGCCGPLHAPMPGDLLCFKIGKQIHHIGLAVSHQKFVHSIQRYGVIISGMNDPTFAKRLQQIYVPVET